MNADRDADDGNSRCTTTATAITCEHTETQLGGRPVSYQVPLGTAPAAGWPAVIYYQGSFIAGSNAFTASSSAPYGQYDLTATFAALLDNGFAVIAPDAINGSYWQTNIPPHATNWSGSADHMFVTALLDAASSGTFGPLDLTHLHAMGISSGGFMTSRMAVSYPGRFRSLAIVAASYATCATSCTVPTLPADHPPTLFLHGDQDSIVPIATMVPYRDRLVANGRTTTAIIGANLGHVWLPDGTTAIPAWFRDH